MNALTLHYCTVSFSSIQAADALERLQDLSMFLLVRQKSVSLKWNSLYPHPLTSSSELWDFGIYSALPGIEGLRLTIGPVWCEIILFLQYLPASGEISLCWTHQTNYVTLPLIDGVHMMQDERPCMHIRRKARLTGEFVFHIQLPWLLTITIPM